MRRVVMLSVLMLLPLAMLGAGVNPQAGQRPHLEQARTDAATASLAALSPDHRTRVLLIVGRYDATTGESTETAATEIAAVLTPAEVQAVFEQQKKLVYTIRISLGEPIEPSEFQVTPRPIDAGRFLVSVLVRRAPGAKAVKAPGP